VTSTSTYPLLLAAGAALRATAVRFFLGFFLRGFGGAAGSELAVTAGAVVWSGVVGFTLGGLFLLKDGKPNQPVD
jgi:hypothetical protein